jgi:hypothetical protein
VGMKCKSCNSRTAVSRANRPHGQEPICEVCLMNKFKSRINGKIDKSLTDTQLIQNHTVRVLLDGCRECGEHGIGFEAGVQRENNLKWYIIKVQCGNCRVNYKEIMEVRIDESNTDNK